MQRQPLTFATVPRIWPGETVVCLGSGPSLTQVDVEFVRGKARVIAVNDSHRLAPWADVLYACDAKWWDTYKGVPTFTGLKYSLTAPHGRYGIHRLRQTGADGLELDPSGLRTGRNSGYQAINLAVHFGAARIILLGYDMQQTAKRSHWFGEHPAGLNQTNDAKLIQWRQSFATLVAPLKALHIVIVNASRETALTCFPRVPLREALSQAVAA